MVDDKLIEKKYISIPVVGWLCEIHIKHRKELLDLEQFALKFIYKDNSIKNLIEAFNVGYQVMIFIITNLFYRGLIQLDLNSSRVQLTRKIIPFIEMDKLDQYLQSEGSTKTRYFVFYQERIGGELLMDNWIEDFLGPYPPLEEVYNFNQNYASFPDIKEFTSRKFGKCAIKRIGADIDNIIKVKFLNLRRENRIHIPLTRRDNDLILDIGDSSIPPHVYFSWLNTLKSFLPDVKKIDTVKTPYFTINLEIKKEAITLIKEFKENLDLIAREGEIIDIEDIYKDFDKKITDLTDELTNRIVNAGHINIVTKNFSDFIKSIWDEIINKNKFIIIGISEFHSSIIGRIEQFVNTIPIKGCELVIIWGRYGKNNSKLTKSEILVNIKSFDEKLKNIHFIEANSAFIRNFILFDTNTLIVTSKPIFLYENSEFFTYFINSGGKLVEEIFDFVIMNTPHYYLVRKKLEEIMSNSLQDTILSPFERNLIKKKNILENHIRANEQKSIVKLILDIKSLIGQTTKIKSATIIEKEFIEDTLLDFIANREGDILGFFNILGEHFPSFYFLESLKKKNTNCLIYSLDIPRIEEINKNLQKNSKLELKFIESVPFGMILFDKHQILLSSDSPYSFKFKHSNPLNILLTTESTTEKMVENIKMYYLNDD